MCAAERPYMSQTPLRTVRRVSSRADCLVRNPPGTTPAELSARLLRITARHVQVCLGVLWLLDGALQFQPFMYTKGFFTQIVGPAISGQPAPIASSMTWAVHIAEPHHAVFNTVFALAQIVIGGGLFFSKTVRPALAASFVWGVGVWWFGEGLGQLFTNASPLTGAPGAAILYVLVGALVWPTRRHGATPEAASAVASGRSGEFAGTTVWAVLWLGMAALWLTPDNRSPNAVRDVLSGVSGATGVLGGLLDASARAAAGRGTAIAVALAMTSAAVGVGVFSRYRAPFLAGGIIISLFYWLFGQALGGITTGTATDPNAGLLFVLLALKLMPTSRAPRPPDDGRPPLWWTVHSDARPESGHCDGSLLPLESVSSSRLASSPLTRGHLGVAKTRPRASGSTPAAATSARQTSERP